MVKTDSAGVAGIVKFNPDAVSVVPSDLFISLEDRPSDVELW